jgi:hypothetical protein
LKPVIGETEHARELFCAGGARGADLYLAPVDIQRGCRLSRADPHTPIVGSNAAGIGIFRSFTCYGSVPGRKDNESDDKIYATLHGYSISEREMIIFFHWRTCHCKCDRQR